MKPKRSETFLWAWVAWLALVVALFAANAYLAMPTALRVWPTGACVAVADPAAESEGRPAYTCETLPKRHHTEWVSR